MLKMHKIVFFVAIIFDQKINTNVYYVSRYMCIFSEFFKAGKFEFQSFQIKTSMELGLHLKFSYNRRSTLFTKMFHAFLTVFGITKKIISGALAHRARQAPLAL